MLYNILARIYDAHIGDCVIGNLFEKPVKALRLPDTGMEPDMPMVIKFFCFIPMGSCS